MMLLELFTKNPAIMEALKLEGKTAKLGEIVNRILINSGIQDYEKIVTDIASDPQELMRQQMDQFNQLISGNNLNAIPAGQPQGQMPQGMPQGQQIPQGGTSGF